MRHLPVLFPAITPRIAKLLCTRLDLHCGQVKPVGGQGRVAKPIGMIQAVTLSQILRKHLVKRISVIKFKHSWFSFEKGDWMTCSGQLTITFPVMQANRSCTKTKVLTPPVAKITPVQWPVRGFFYCWFLCFSRFPVWDSCNLATCYCKLVCSGMFCMW